MRRRSKKVRRKPTNLTLNPAIVAEAEKLLGPDESLSRLVENLLSAEIGRHSLPLAAEDQAAYGEVGDDAKADPARKARAALKKRGEPS